MTSEEIEQPSEQPEEDREEAKFDEIVQASMLISLFSGVDPETKYFENIPVLRGGQGLITDSKARLKVEEAFGQLNLPDLFKTFDFSLHRSSYIPYKLKEDLVIAPYIYTVKARHQDTFVMSLFLTPWSDVNLSQFQDKIIDFATDFSGIFRRATEEVHRGADLNHRRMECEKGASMLMGYLNHLVFDQRQMLGGTEKVSKPTNLLAVLFQRGKIGRFFACLGECGNSFSAKKYPELDSCPNCGGKISTQPIRIYTPRDVSFGFPDGFVKVEKGEISVDFKLHGPLELIYLFQSSYLPNEIRITLNRIAENIFASIVPLPHQALFEYRDSDDLLTLYSLSRLDGDDILMISGISDSRSPIEGQLGSMALRIFVRDIGEGVKKGYSREEIFRKSILKDWILSEWVSLGKEGPPEDLNSWTKLAETVESQ